MIDLTVSSTSSSIASIWPGVGSPFCRSSHKRFKRVESLSTASKRGSVFTGLKVEVPRLIWACSVRPLPHVIASLMTPRPSLYYEGKSVFSQINIPDPAATFEHMSLSRSRLRSNLNPTLQLPPSLLPWHYRAFRTGTVDCHSLNFTCRVSEKFHRGTG